MKLDLKYRLDPCFASAWGIGPLAFDQSRAKGKDQSRAKVDQPKRYPEDFLILIINDPSASVNPVTK